LIKVEIHEGRVERWARRKRRNPAQPASNNDAPEASVIPERAFCAKSDTTP
jgi:hypothetical protein